MGISNIPIVKGGFPDGQYSCRNCSSAENTEDFPLVVCQAVQCVANRKDGTLLDKNDRVAFHLRCGRLTHKKGDPWVCSSCIYAHQEKNTSQEIEVDLKKNK